MRVGKLCGNTKRRNLTRTEKEKIERKTKNEKRVKEKREKWGMKFGV